MLCLNTYLDNLINHCIAAFGDRLLYIGLQGSYLRSEATEESDVDIMMILDQLTVSDMDAYRSILEQIGYKEKSCGFLCGRQEMAHWNPLEVHQLQCTTKDLYGKLTDYLPHTTRQDAINDCILMLGNLYHELCHRYVHRGRERSREALRGCGKSLFFLIQSLYKLETGTFVLTKKELKQAARADDREMLELSELPDDFDFDTIFASVIRWCQDAFLCLDRLQRQERGDA